MGGVPIDEELPPEEPPAREPLPDQDPLENEPSLDVPEVVLVERPRADVVGIANTFNLHDRLNGVVSKRISRDPRSTLREDGTMAILKDQLAALVAAEEFRQRQETLAAEIEALRQAIRDLGGEPKA